MSLSIDSRSATQGPEPTGGASAPAAFTPAAAVSTGTDRSVVDVLFPLVDDDEWPPCPAEQIEAVLISHDLAEIRGVPWFAANISRGDIVNVRHDGIGYVGGTVVSRGGHSTVHVMAASEAELAPIVKQLVALGASTAGGLTPPMLTVDIPESVALDPILDVLAAAESMTCAHTVACRQHRPSGTRE
ncbi:DUF4265 domain-containing protein [Nakamurella sp. GG22]